MAKDSKTKNNTFTIRIVSDDTLNLIEDLLKTGIYKSANDLLNKCIEVGIKEVFLKTFDKKVLGEVNITQAKSDYIERDLYRRLKQIEMTTDDMFVMLSILEYLMTTIFNVHSAELLELPIDADMMLNGELSELPQNLKAVKDEIIKRLSKKEK